MHYRDGDLRVVVKQKQKGSAFQSYPLLTGVPLNARFDIAISDIGNGQMTFSATYNGQTQQASSPVPDKIPRRDGPLQVGDYQQAGHSKGANDGAITSIRSASSPRPLKPRCPLRPPGAGPPVLTRAAPPVHPDPAAEGLSRTPGFRGRWRAADLIKVTFAAVVGALACFVGLAL